MKIIILSILYMLLGIIFTESATKSTRMDTIIRDTKQKKVDNDSVLHVDMFTDTDKESTMRSTNKPHVIVMKNNTFGNNSYKVHLPTVDTIVNDYEEKFVEQTVDNIGSLNDDNSGTSNWTNVNYESSSFGLKAQIQVALLGKIHHNATFIHIKLFDVNAYEEKSKVIDVVIDLQAFKDTGLFTWYKIYVTVTRDGGAYMWSHIQLYDGLTNYVDQNKRYQTKAGHSYRCDAPDTIVLENTAAIFIRNFSYRAFIESNALKQVDGCQGSFTYTMYGGVGAFCAILICITIITVIIKYRRWHKDRAAYENLDRRFRP